MARNPSHTSEREKRYLQLRTGVFLSHWGIFVADWGIFVATSLNWVGDAEIFGCKACGWSCDRDENGARNVLLKFCADNLINVEEDMDVDIP